MTDTTTDGQSFCVIIPTRDRTDQARSQVEVLRQLDDAPRQIVVVCDGLHDDTAPLLRAMPTPPTVVSTPEVGPATARNVGVANSHCGWLVFLDDDDQPGPRWMTTFRSLLGQHPDASYLSTGFVRRVDGAESLMAPQQLGPTFSGQTGNFVAGTFAVREDLFRAVGGFTEGLRCLEFTDLAIRCFARIRRDRLMTASSSDATLTIVVRPPSERASQNPHVLDAAWRQVERTNLRQFEADPQFHADQLSSLGVAWMRYGDTAAARRYLYAAARRHPDHHTVARALVASVPGLAPRIWRAVSRSGDAART